MFEKTDLRKKNNEEIHGIVKNKNNFFFLQSWKLTTAQAK